jgi:hypothetical protein
MFKKFQSLVNTILENVNASSAVFGTPQQAVYNPPDNANSGNTYAPNDNRNLFGAYETKKSERKPSNSKKMGKKVGKVRKTPKSTAKMFPVIKRTFPETFLGAK